MARAGISSAAMTPFLPYSADSFFKSKVIGAPVDAARTSQFHSFMTTFPDQRGYSAPSINGLTAGSWGTAYAMASASDPIWRLTGAVPSVLSFLKTQGFHAPDGFSKQIMGTGDSPFCVIDRGSGFTVFGAGAHGANAATRTIPVGSSGIMYHSSNGLSQGDPLSNDNRNQTGRGRITESMVIRRDLVDAAIANGTGLGHVLQIFLCATNSRDGFCHPMTGCETRHTEGWGAEGERIAISPSVRLESRGLSPFGLAIARTLQEHGAYIGDNAGGQSSLKAQQASSASNPWAGLTVSQDCLQGKVTWSDFVVLPMGWQ
jgi:hypothetical protein